MPNIKEFETNAAPLPVGPYSQAICFGNLLFISGQLPICPKVNKIVAQDITGQCEQAIINILSILESEGYSLSNIVKTTVYLSDINDFQEMNHVYSKFFSAPCPARVALEVSRLPMDALVEIEAIAAIK